MTSTGHGSGEMLGVSQGGGHWEQSGEWAKRDPPPSEYLQLTKVPDPKELLLCRQRGMADSGHEAECASSHALRGKLLQDFKQGRDEG